MNINFNIGFIGCGNMASAIITGMISKVSATQIYVFDINETATQALNHKFNINVCKSVQDLCQKCEMIFLAIKPQNTPNLLQQNKLLFENKAVVSIVAGISISELSQMLPKSTTLIRTMPNTPALVLQGATALCKETTLCEAHKTAIFEIFSCLGMCFWVEEKLIDGVVGISGSGPAYCFIFIEAMADAGVREGLPRELAYTLAAQTLKGAGEMVLKTNQNPASLKDMVCSPAGTTIEAVNALEKNNFRYAVQSAVSSAAKKSREFSK